MFMNIQDALKFAIIIQMPVPVHMESILSQHCACRWRSTLISRVMFEMYSCFLYIPLDFASFPTSICAEYIKQNTRCHLLRPRAISELTQRGPVTHICVSKITIIGSYSGLSPRLCHAIIWLNARILLITPLQWNLNQNVYISLEENAFVNVVWKMVVILSPPQCVKYQLAKYM